MCQVGAKYSSSAQSLIQPPPTDLAQLTSQPSWGTHPGQTTRSTSLHASCPMPPKVMPRSNHQRVGGSCSWRATPALSRTAAAACFPETHCRRYARQEDAVQLGPAGSGRLGYTLAWHLQGSCYELSLEQPPRALRGQCRPGRVGAWALTVRQWW